MKIISDNPHVIGMYVIDSEELYNTSSMRVHLDDKYKGYIPLFSLININHTSEVRFSDTISKSNEIVSYDRTTSGKKLSDAVVRSKRVDITHNDLYVGDINIVLNFTSKDVTINCHDEFRKTFTKLKQDKFEDYAGHLVFFTIRTLNTPTFIQDITGVSDYFTALINKLEKRKNNKISRTCEIYRFARDNWHRFNKNVNGLIANSIKVIEMRMVHESEFSKEDITLESNDFCISTNNIFDISDNPYATLNSTGIRDIRDIFPEHSFMCYIVDNEDLVGDRYINVAGYTKKINKIKNRSLPSGLYFAEKGTTDPKGELFCKLDEMDGNGYVYKSREEASEGADVRRQYADELENFRVESARQKSEHERETNRLKAEQERLKSEHERELSSLKMEAERRSADFESARQNFERELMSRKHSQELTRFDLDSKSMRNKYNYETERYERDTTIETLKTFAAGLGVASTVFLIANKFIK